MYTDDWTEKQLRELERSLAGIYREASADLRAKVDQYWNGWDETIKENGETKVIHHAGFRERYEKEYQAYKEGKYTKEEFEAWCRAQVARGQRWEAMRDQMAERLTNTNVIAADYINNDIPRIFAENANYEAFKIEQVTGTSSFTLVNEDAVKHLSTGGKLILPHMGIGITKDQAWNAQKLQNSLLQGILQGESIGKIADRFQAVSNMNRSAAIRNARTAVTGAQNAGRQNTMERALDMGIELQKEWKATEDARTRESHARLDGVRVELDDTFPNGCRWPGDPLGAPEEVYNCRCVMKTIYPRYNGEPRLAKYYDPVSGEYKERYNTVDSYNRWKEEKADKGLWWNKEESTKSNSEHDFSVKFDPKSEPYKARLSALSENEDAMHSVYNEVAEILRHRGGTKYEDLVYIDSSNGTYKIQKRYNVESEVLPTESMKQMVINAGRNTVIAIHNHPLGTPPSYADLYNSLKYKYGLVVGHNGAVYKYRANSGLPKEGDASFDAVKLLIDSHINYIDKTIENGNIIDRKELNENISWFKDFFDIDIEVL